MRDMFWTEKDNCYQFEGILDRCVHYITEVQLLREDLWVRFVQQFKEDADYDAGWRGEYWGKMMRGACLVYSYSHDRQLYEVLTNTVKDMLTAQAENGRISSYGENHEFEGWDIWGRKYVLLGMQYYLEICEDAMLSTKIVDSMRRQADYIMKKIGDIEEGKILITKASCHFRGINSSSLLEPIVRLYKITKEQKYLEFATYIIRCGGTDIVNVFELAYQDKMYPYQYPITKAYEVISCFEGLLEYYRATGNEECKASVINFANKVLESDFTIIGSCGCTHEFFDHSTVRQANTNNGSMMQETCVTVTLMKFLYQVTLLTGEARYVDAFEISLYNAYLGAINTEQVIEPSLLAEHPEWSIEFLPFDSYSPLTAGTRGNGIGGLKLMSDNHYYGCCACIGSAGLGLVSKLALLTTERGFAINMYVAGSVETVTTAGKKLTLHMETDYPVNGNVKITVDMEKEEEFELLVRIPAWSSQTSLSVNGEAVKTSVGYTTMSRVWHAGDSIELGFDMRTKSLHPVSYGSQLLMNGVVLGGNYIIPTYDEEDPNAKNHIALQRGPIILAQENRLGYSVDEAVKIKVQEDGYVDVTIPKKEIAPYKHILELEVPLEDGKKMHVTDYASAGKFWTEESKMAAWILVSE